GRKSSITHRRRDEAKAPQRKSLQGLIWLFRPPEVPTNTRRLTTLEFIHTRRATRAVVGADSEKADGVYLKRPAPGPAPCRRANPGLHLATLQASGRVALAPRRCAVTRA